MLLSLLYTLAAGPVGDAAQQPAPSIRALDAREYVGRRVTLEGTVAAIRVSRNGTVHLDLEKPAPDQAISAVVPATVAARFTGLKKLGGKRVQITGLVARGRRGLEMFLEDPVQLKMAATPERIPCG